MITAEEQNSMPSFSLKGKTAIVTGGASGIGAAIATLFAQEGAFVNILDLDRERAAELAQTIASAGGRAAGHACDVASQTAVTAAISQIASQATLDILVNNAGVSHVGNVETTSESDFDRVFQINVKSVYNCAQAAIAHMKPQKRGVILNMASIAAHVALADRFAYSMSKGAVLAMTYSIAKDCLPYNIRCNSISPARVHTPFVDGYLAKNYPGHEREMFEKLSHAQPIGRMGKPEEIASLALFLCSDSAAFITGMDFPIDGGALKLSI
jgi:NAD(P)-dependent dehydrogenase (short-subunit alcohol dehydrogenase family)